uniref:C-factor n=1 Tax=Anas zonorhyncha TaxID=75864 RepID=A0A8B9V698_9AVES
YRDVLVTGSNRGIGLELVRQLAASPQPPQHIFATCRDPDGPRGKALRELSAQHPSIRLVQLVDLPSIRRAVQVVESCLEGQGLNLLINNAGIGSHATLPETLKRVCINRAWVSLCQEFLPLLEKAAKGAQKTGLSCSRAAIVNVSSKVGSIGHWGPWRGAHGVVLAWPCLFQAAQNMVTRCLAAELRDKGLLCTAIHPGWVKTDMGTEQAPMTVERSVQGILAVLGSLSQETSGAFLDWEGNSLPW